MTRPYKPVSADLIVRNFHLTISGQSAFPAPARVDLAGSDRIVGKQELTQNWGYFLLVTRNRLSIGYCAGWGGTTAQPPLVPLTRVAVADWMDVSAAILGKALIDSGVLAQAGTPSTS
jgi:hypothetical protein